MSRKTKTLAIGIAVLAAAYSAAWYITAQRAEERVDRLLVAPGAEAAGSIGPALHAASHSLGGFPFKMVLRLEGFSADGFRHDPDLKVQAEEATLATWPFYPWSWHLDLPKGGAVTGPGVSASFSRAKADGLAGDDYGPWGSHAKLAVRDLAVRVGGESGPEYKAGSLTVEVHLPDAPPATRADPLFTLSFAADGMVLPNAPAALGPGIGHVALDGSFMGPAKGARPSELVASWHAAGGNIEVQKLDVDWGPLTLTATGNASVDDKLQPQGAFTAEIAHYDAILQALVASGTIKPQQARYIGLGLSILSQGGGDAGRLRTPIAVQDGAFFIGPAKIGKVPPVTWP